MNKIKFLGFGALFMLFSIALRAQIPEGVYFSAQENVVHELKVGENYIVYSIYERTPAKFVKTVGGFFTTADKILKIDLEFNSDFEKDGLKEMTIPYNTEGDMITFQTDSPLVFKLQDISKQELDGLWLFATRGPDTGQERRGDNKTRKTLKFLFNGRFQWIAYDTNGMQFKGTGGGSYSSEDGIYTENIEYFSRDNDRVGARLEFNYEIKRDDWHHKGKNSRGEPMYEIWSKR